MNKYFSGGRWQVQSLSYITDITNMIKGWFANTCNMIVERKMIVESDTNISSFLWGADGLTDDSDFLNNWYIGRCLAEITSGSVLSLFSLRRLTSIQWSISSTQRSMLARYSWLKGQIKLRIISTKMITQAKFLNNVRKRWSVGPNWIWYAN